MRDRDIYRIETALLEAGETPTIAHKLFNAETGALCTTMQQTLMPRLASTYALHFALRKPHPIERFGELLARGADLDLPDAKGHTAGQIASRKRDPAWNAAVLHTQPHD